MTWSRTTFWSAPSFSKTSEENRASCITHSTDLWPTDIYGPLGLAFPFVYTFYIYIISYHFYIIQLTNQGPRPHKLIGVWWTKCQIKKPIHPSLHSSTLVVSMISFCSAAGIHQFTMYPEFLRHSGGSVPKIPYPGNPRGSRSPKISKSQ